ncbi:MAG: DNA repair protein [Chloroflexi bacterium]|nr:DNA repair protein [Chloroflexota bacterium]
MPPDRLYFTGDVEADALLAREPMALLIGFVLDQQVTVQKAFSGPLELRRRLGTLDADRIAAMDPTTLEKAFRERPALHRFPGSMARRTQELCSAVSERYGDDAARIWDEARDAADLRRRLLELPGIGGMKADGLLVILARRFGVSLDGWDAVLPDGPTLGDVDSEEALARYQAAKRARKSAQRAGG